MRARSLFVKTLRDQRWQVLGYGATLFAMAALIVRIWPSYRTSLEVIDLPPAIEAFLGTDLWIGTAPGFISAEYFSWIPILLIAFAVVQGTGAVAGEESSGTIDILLAQPLPRSEMLAVKAAATVLGATAIAMMGFLGFAVTVPVTDIAVSVGETFVASANLLPITLVFYALSLWLGAVAPSRSIAAGIAIGLVTLAYFSNTIAAGVDALDWMRYASPFYYYGAGLPLVDGINWLHAGSLLGVAAGFFVLTLRTFAARDVTIGGAAELDVAAVLRRIATMRAG
ncbi:MAG: ABC transporter permease subunit [Dehalococcoidia bacterium]